MIDPSRTGSHPTGTQVPFGAAAVCLLGLGEIAWQYAFGNVAMQVEGSKASGGTMYKPFHSGAAAMNGLFAAGTRRARLRTPS
jgi:2-methylcitrate dehydratase PrpD